MMHFSTNRKLKKYSAYAFSAAVLLFIWFIAAKLVNSSLILPEPLEVFLFIGKNTASLSFWKNFLVTFCRILSGFLISLVSGIIAGILCGEFQFFDDFFQLPLTIISSTPVVAMILIILFWFPSGFVPVFITFLMNLPVMISAVKSGIKNTDSDLVFFVKSRNFSRFKILRYVKLPSCRINILEAALRCFSLSWKVVVAGEVLCLPKFAAGSRLHLSQIHLETADVMAQTILLIFISFVLELALKKVVQIIELKIQNN